MNYLIVVAHPDDEVLGAGATIHKLISAGHAVAVCTMANHAAARANISATLTEDQANAMRIMGVSKCYAADFPNIRMNTVPHLELVQFIERCIEDFGADAVITHHPSDTNNDHMMTSYAAQAAARLFQRKPGIPALKLFLYMEVPSSTDWSLDSSSHRFTPNYFVEIGKEGVELKSADVPILFSKFANALVPCGAAVELPEWEESYDYEAELVIVMGRRAWNVSEAEAGGYIFGYTCGNDLSCRAPQQRTSQWLIGKSMPGFGPCGPCIVTADEFDPARGMGIKSYVNGELRQNGSTADMISSCARIISYASRYIALEPGDLIFTGTPSGVALEKGKKLPWLKKGDVVDIEIEGIGRLTNRMV